ncbi:MAG: tetratricopeptide repeat protein [Deltaproteobacteria bacterium]|nr:tetratricopeptide repeat protein [Deltaproteobacteria bacterium]
MINVQPDTTKQAGFGTAFSLTILLLLIVLAYAHSFKAAWQLDDITNILDNPNIQVTTLSLDDWLWSVRSPFEASSNTKPGLYRPVAMLTFAANWYMGGANVFGYHLVNTCIHAVNAVLLYFTVLILLNAPNLKNRYRETAHFIAVLSTALWALHPIQTQAVTYIVQRMASLAATFYLAGIFFYLKGRNASSPNHRGLYWGLCLISYFLAIGTKQNAVTLPVALVLVNIIFYASPGYWKRLKLKWIWGGLLLGLFITVVARWLFEGGGAVATLGGGYDMRPFTMLERLMTEFRVMVFYFYQLFYPVTEQFSILHDFEISRSLLKPWTTLPAMVICGGLVVTALSRMHRWPLMSFSILFFFLGHSLESTIVPLELVFEHRNYLPSLFLFLPLASATARLVRHFSKRNKLIYGCLIIAGSLVILSMGMATYTRNMAWASPKSLWQDAMQKAPALARPYQGVAQALEREGRLDRALELYEIALEKSDPAPQLSRFISLSNIGNIYKKVGAYDRAVHNLEAAVKVETGSYTNRTRYNLALCLLNSEKISDALSHLDVLLSRDKTNSHFLTAKGYILFQQGDSEAAMDYFTHAKRQNPYDKDALIGMAMALSAKGFHERADRMLLTANDRYSSNIIIYLGLLQNALQWNNLERVDRYLTDITSRFNLNTMERYLSAYKNGHRYIDDTLVPVQDSTVVPVLVAFLQLQAETLIDITGVDK